MKKFQENLHNYLTLPSSSSILDVGCGEGNLLVDFFRQGHSVLGIDNDPSLAFDDTVSDKIINEDALLTLAKLKDENQTFDLVIFSFSIMFFTPEERSFCIRLAKNLLKDGGFLYAGVMNEFEDTRLSILEKEYLSWVDDMEIEYLQKEKVFDKPHRGRMEPHYHFVTHILGRKK